jgi:hypothetical protein
VPSPCAARPRASNRDHREDAESAEAAEMVS